MKLKRFHSLLLIFPLWLLTTLSSVNLYAYTANSKKSDSENLTQIQKDCKSNWNRFVKENPDHEIGDQEAFCRGVDEAQEVDQLNLKWALNAFSIDDCIRYSFERFGIELDCIGETTDQVTLDEIAGYNFIMNKRIKLKLGSRYNQLGATDSRYFSPSDLFTQEFYEELNNKLLIRQGIWGNLKIRLPKKAFSKNYNKIKIVDKDSEKSFLFEQLYKKGVKIYLSRQDEQRKTKLFRFNIADYKSNFFCKSKNTADSYLVTLKFDKYLDKWANKTH